MENSESHARKHVVKYEPYVLAACEDVGIEPPVAEYRFHPTRKWRFDFAWPSLLLGLEVNGGAWIYGRHNRAASYLRDLQKYNAAAALGWRIFYLTPAQVSEVSYLSELLRSYVRAVAQAR